MSEDQEYMMGRRSAWLSMLDECLKNLGVDDPEVGKARWISEREDAIEALRRVCEEHGDNEWDEKLYLADVIEKHLENHLEASAAEPTTETGGADDGS
jgi:hypothetical protein